MNEAKVYTVTELAEIWKCSTDIIYDLLTQNKLEGFKLGRTWRISDTARLAYEQRGADQPKVNKGRKRPVQYIV